MFSLIAYKKKTVLTRTLRVKIDSVVSNGGQRKLIYFKYTLWPPFEVEL